MANFFTDRNNENGCIFDAATQTALLKLQSLYLSDLDIQAPESDDWVPADKVCEQYLDWLTEGGRNLAVNASTYSQFLNDHDWKDYIKSLQYDPTPFAII